jgi:hypothetical protein
VRPIPTSVLFLALAASPALAQTPTAEDSAGVQVALQHYLNGHATGDSAQRERPLGDYSQELQFCAKIPLIDTLFN